MKNVEKIECACENTMKTKKHKRAQSVGTERMLAAFSQLVLAHKACEGVFNHRIRGAYKDTMSEGPRLCIDLGQFVR